MDQIQDRRKSPRLPLRVPINLKGTDVLGRPFEEDGVTTNVSSGGVYLTARNELLPSSEVEIRLDISSQQPAAVSAFAIPYAELYTCGRVIRVDDGETRKASGTVGVAVSFTSEFNYSFAPTM